MKRSTQILLDRHDLVRLAACRSRVSGRARRSVPVGTGLVAARVTGRVGVGIRVGVCVATTTARVTGVRRVGRGRAGRVVLVGVARIGLRRIVVGATGSAGIFILIDGPIPSFLSLIARKAFDLGVGEDHLREVGHPLIPSRVADDRASLDLVAMLDVEIDFVHHRLPCDPFEVRHFTIATNAAVLLNNGFELGNELLIVLMHQLAVDSHCYDVASALRKNFEH